ncbi:MAG: C4-type zinc ribbon domain-containing protein, partial [candidate division WOR-3 bacterium]
KKRYKLLEIDIREYDEKINSKSGQLFSTKSNEIYKALLKEIENLRNAKQAREEQMIEIMEQLERAEEKVVSLEREVVNIEQETSERVATLERELGELQAAVAKRETERAAVLASLDRTVAGVYERIRRNKRGAAAVGVSGERCNGCLNPIPPQLLIEVSKKDRLHFCEHCGRILIPPDLT